MDLVHILVKAAIRDPVIALEVDNAIQSRHASAPGDPLDPPSSLPRTYSGPPTRMASPESEQSYPYTSSSSGSEANYTPNFLPSAEPLKTVPDPNNHYLDEVQEDREVPGGLALQPATRTRDLGHQTAGDEEAMEDEEPMEDGEPMEDQAPGPLEEPIGYPGILKEVRTGLGWYMKMNRSYFRREDSLAMKATSNTSHRLDKLVEDMGKYHSYRNRLYILTVIRKIILCCIQTRGSHIADEIHANHYDYDGKFLTALQTMTPDQRRRLRWENMCLWFLELILLIRSARNNNVYPKLHAVFFLVDPGYGRMVEPWGDGEAA
ncbi:uncharacterized protein PG986_006437 [Apiospora aurea]|uniref:Uncharacterized protein n=1 Tax=Apiospora aurea TaxID=335848 RepID=A0ABR1QKF0_9PEZI